MNKLVLIFIALLSLNAFSSEVRVVELSTPTSYSCYGEDSNSKSKITFYFGEYTEDTNGEQVFNYSADYDTIYMSHEMCHKIEFIYKTVENDNDEENSIIILLNTEDKLVGFQNPTNKKIFILE